MKVERGLISKLKRQMKRSIQLHEDYLRLLQSERSSITSFNADNIQVLSEKRKLLTNALDEANAELFKLMAEFPNSEGRKLREIIAAFVPKQEVGELMSMAEKLRALAKQSQSQNLEHSYLVSFARNAINGTVSLFWQATQNVTQRYNRGGSIQKSYNPKTNRSDTVLKQA